MVFGQKSVRKSFSRLTRNFPDHPETILTIRKLSRLSGNFVDHLENIQTIRKLSGPSGNFPSAISRVMRKNFRDAQKLSGWQCHDATMVFVPLHVPQKIGFFQRKGRKRMKEWRKVTFMSTMATFRRWTYPNTFFRFQKRAILKFPEVQLNFYLVNFMVC